MSRYEVEIQNDVPVDESLFDMLRDAAMATLSYLGAPPQTALTILLTSDDRIRDFNRDFAGQDSPTDVLSFPAGNWMPGVEGYLGDIAVSVTTAERQALDSGHTLASEMQILIVHAVLHLMGYDHADADEKAEMWLVQTAVLDLLEEYLASTAE